MEIENTSKGEMVDEVGGWRRRIFQDQEGVMLDCEDPGSKHTWDARGGEKSSGLARGGAQGRKWLGKPRESGLHPGARRWRAGKVFHQQVETVMWEGRGVVGPDLPDHRVQACRYHGNQDQGAWSGIFLFLCV